MNEKETTYSTGEMMKLINTAATNLLLKEKKVSLEARIRRQREELQYIRELLESAQKKVAELDPEILELEERASKSRQDLALLKTHRDGMKNELEELRGIERKEPLLQRRRAELAAIHESVAEMQERCDSVRSMAGRKAARIEELEYKKHGVMKDFQELKEKLKALNGAGEQLFLRLAGFDLSGYLERLRTEVGTLDDRLHDKINSSSPEEDIDLLIDFLRCAGQVVDFYRIMEEAGIEEGLVFTGFNEIKNSGIHASMKVAIKQQIAEFASCARNETLVLEKRKIVIDAAVESAEERIAQIRKDAAGIEEEIRNEQGIRDYSQQSLEKLDQERAAQEAELEHITKEAERLMKLKDFNKTFTTALAPSNEYLRNINNKLNALIEDYKKALYPALKVIKST